MPKKHKGINKLVILVAGSGPTDRNCNSVLMKTNAFKMLAEGLCLKGISTFRYDKRMIGESKDTSITENDLRFDTYVNDLVEIVRLFKKDERFNKIIIAGHSEGSLIGIIAAERVDVDKYISISGVGVSADEILKEQLKNKKKSFVDESYAIIDSLKLGILVDSLSKDMSISFRPSVQPYLVSWFKYNPAEEIAKLKIPVLIIQGDNDIQVKVKNAELLHDANKNSKMEIIIGMNHVFKYVESDNYTENLKTYYNLDLPLHEQLIPTMVNFISN